MMAAHTTRLALSTAALATVLACVGSDPAESPGPATGSLDGPCFSTGECNPGLRCFRDRCVPPDEPTDGGGLDANVVADSGSEPGDAGGDAASDAGTCSAPSGTPCSCGTGRSCCVQQTGNHVCQPSGNESDPTCTSTNTIRCVSRSGCAPGSKCCFNGEVSPSQGACPREMTLRDTECSPTTCDDASGSRPELCVTKNDCPPDHQCALAKMAGTSLVFGICEALSVTP